MTPKSAATLVHTEWDRYVRESPRDGRIIEKGREYGLTAQQSLEFGDVVTSAGQTDRNYRGSRFEKALESGLIAIAGVEKVSRQVRIENGEGIRIDFKVSTKHMDWYITVKVSARERADKAWTKELNAIEWHQKKVGRPFEFFAVVAEPHKPSLGAKLPPEVQYGSILTPGFLHRLFVRIQDSL